MKKDKFFKVIWGILDVFLIIVFMAMISGYYEFTTFNKVILWIWFIVFIINYFLKFINQFKQMKLINLCKRRLTNLQEMATLLSKLKPFLDDSEFQERKKLLTECCQKEIEIINLILEENILKIYNQEYLEDLKKIIDDLPSSV